HHLRLIGGYSHGLAVNPAETDDDIFGKVLLDLHKVTTIDDAFNHLPHVIYLGSLRGNYFDHIIHPTIVSFFIDARRIFHVILRQKTKQPPHLIQHFWFRWGGKVGIAADAGVDPSP